MSKMYISPAKQKWCQEKAQYFFGIKEKTQRYPVDVYYPEVDETIELVFDEDELRAHREFQEEVRKEFLEECPKDENDAKAWDECLSEAYEDALEYGRFGKINIYDTVDADIKMVHLDKGVNVYEFTVRYYGASNTELSSKKRCFVELTDEEYVTLLTEVLEDPDISVASLINSQPAIYEKIMKEALIYEMECAVFMTEIRQDAQRILGTEGGEMPR